MHAVRFVPSHLQRTCPHIHAKRLQVFLAAVETATRHHRLMLTELGRALRSRVSVKRQIKRMDRLAGHRQLGSERPFQANLRPYPLGALDLDWIRDAIYYFGRLEERVSMAS